jgi:hypothetical protein
MTDTLAGLREEWERKPQSGKDVLDRRAGSWTVEFVERLFARAEAAERERELDLVALEAAEKEVDALQARVAACEQAIVKMAEPYEALRMDDESRRWIAPEVWKTIVEATEQARALLAPPASQRRGPA